jgi:NADH-quinone oxidoreductase subunit H
VGPWGIIQPIADMLKIFTKEYITPAGSDWIPFNLAPILAVGSVMMIWAVLPFANRIFGVDLNVGALYIIAVGALGTLAIILAGWSSNNKFALLGAFRAVALLLSYEVPMVLALLVPVILARSMGLNTIVEKQDIWYLFIAPIPAFVFFLTSMAEIGRSPFDLLEAESEIATGFIVEYSGLKFGMFYVAEFMHAFTISMIFSTLFLGGWRGPGAEQYPLLGVLWYIIKTFLVYFVVILMRGSLPRFRTDQILDLTWKQLTPLSLVILIVTAILDKVLLPGPFLVRAVVLLLANLVVGWIMLQLFQSMNRSRKIPLVGPVKAAPVSENNA